MVENIIEKMSCYVVDNLLYKNEKVSEENREVMLFGVTRIIEDLPKYVIILFIGIIFDILKYIALVFAVNLAYKTFVGGVHAKDNISCLFTSIIIYILPVVVSLNLNLSTFYLYVLTGIVFVVSLYIIIHIAPADTEEVPILKKKRRNKLKFFAAISLIILLSITFIAVKNNLIKEIILFSLLEINILATNTAYKLYKCKHSYETEEYASYYNT